MISVSIMTLVFLACMISLMVLNIFIGITAFKHRKMHGVSISSASPDTGPPSDTDSKGRTDTDTELENAVFTCDEPSSTIEEPDHDHISSSGSSGLKSPKFKANTKSKTEAYGRQTSHNASPHKMRPRAGTGGAGTNSKINNFKNRVRSLSVWTVQSNGRSSRGMGRTTKVLFIISLIYILTYLPLLVMQCVKAVFPEGFSDLGTFGMALYYLMVNSPYLGCAANPLIYSLCDPNFRSECRHQAKRVGGSIRRGW